MWFYDFASYSKAVLVDPSLWKISHQGKFIWLEFATTVDNFHFSVPFSEVFLSGSVCVQLSTFPSFALWPSFRKFTGKRCEIRKHNVFPLYYVQWEPVQKSTQAEIRSAHKRIHWHEFHSILEQFTDDTQNLGQV